MFRGIKKPTIRWVLCPEQELNQSAVLCYCIMFQRFGIAIRDNRGTIPIIMLALGRLLCRINLVKKIALSTFYKCPSKSKSSLPTSSFALPVFWEIFANNLTVAGSTYALFACSGNALFSMPSICSTCSGFILNIFSWLSIMLLIWI